MAFDCPSCQRPRIHITMSLELPPDSRSDEITLQVIECAVCGFSGVAVYEESRRGRLQWDNFTHTGYALPLGEIELIKQFLQRCDQRRNRECDCVTHRMFGRQNDEGAWIGLDVIRRDRRFELR